MTSHPEFELLSGYLDGELADAQRQVVDAHLAQCGACRTRYQTLLENQRRLRREARRTAAPPFLRSRIASQLRGAPSAVAARPAIAVPWWGAVAAMAFSAVIAVALTLNIAVPGEGARLDQEIAASHVRSLIGNRTTDVASSDQHTVKPWFSGKLDFSPPVRDFVGEGFPLLGGRVDYIGKRRVAVLVYRRRQHLIDVYVWPAAEGAAPAPAADTIDGFHIERATAADMNFVAISDVNRDDLRALMALLRALPG